MAYSNGYDLTAVNTALASRVGFRQPLGSGVPTLSAPVIATDSGRYYQDFHSLVTVQNIKATMEQVNASDSDLNTYLINLKKAAIQRCLNGVFTGPQVIDEGRIFRRYGTNDQLITNSSLFVGYEIDVAETQDAGVQIDALQLYFDSAVTFNVYLFKDGKLSAEWTQSVTTVANQITEVTLTDKVLAKGKYYLGYFQNDIGSAKAYREQVECWNESYYYGAKAVQCASTGATTFNREQRSYTMQPAGLNADISSFKDHTLQIKRKAAMFDELQGLTLAYMVIEQIIYSTRSNKDERIFKDQLDRVGIQLDLNGVAPISDSPQIMGLRQRIEREVQTVLKSFYKKPKSVIVSRC
jgi:hypothetical protein